MSDYPFPLQAGHHFGPVGWDLAAHDGQGSPAEAAALMEWQRLYALRWGDRDMVATGHFAGPTQRAALRVQLLAGLKLTGNVDEETWVAGLNLGTAPPRTDDVTPDPSKELEQLRRRTAREAKTAANKARHEKETEQREAERKRWKAKSTLEHQYAQPGCPPWWPGHDFGPGTSGAHVGKVYRILGMVPVKEFSGRLGERVRGFRTANGLPIGDWVDLETAKLLDRV